MVRKRRFGREPDRASREEIERQAAAELQRMTSRSQAQPPSFPAPREPPEAPARRPPAPSYGAPEPDEPGPRPVADDEEMAVTEMALMQLAERRGDQRSLEEVIIRGDPYAAEVARDRALRELRERQERLAQTRPKGMPLAPWQQPRWTIGDRPRPYEQEDPELEDEPAWADDLRPGPSPRLTVGKRPAGEKSPAPAKATTARKAAKGTKGTKAATATTSGRATKTAGSKTAGSKTARGTKQAAKAGRGQKAGAPKAASSKKQAVKAAKAQKAAVKSAKTTRSGSPARATAKRNRSS